MSPPAAAAGEGGVARLAALVIATVFALCAVAAVAIAYKGSVAPDFLSFWAAGRLASQGQIASVYTIALHHGVEAQAVPGVGLLPFPYPPFVLPLFVPFGMLPFWLAFGAWVALTAIFYIAVTWHRLEARFSLAQAPAAANFITGQNGFLTAGIFIGGTGMLPSRPFVAGAILGLLCFKPQLAILLPVALLAGREWRAIAGGIVSSLALSIVGLLLFGATSYSSFLAILPHFSNWLSAGRWPWGELASPFALLRWFGVPMRAALVVHGIVAVGAAALTGRAWWRKDEARVPILAAATLLIPPYLFTYDALLLTLPLAWLAKERRQAAFVAAWLLSLLPAIAYLRPFPNTIPVAAMLSLWALHRRQAASSEAPSRAVA